MVSERATLGFWKTVLLLLKVSRTRADGRLHRQRQLLNNRGASNWGSLGVVLTFAVMAFLHGIAAVTLISAVKAGEQIDIAHQGKLIVSEFFLDKAHSFGQIKDLGPNYTSIALDSYFAPEAERIAEQDGGNASQIEHKLRSSIAASGTRNLVNQDEIDSGSSAFLRLGPASDMLGSLVLVWWFAMVVCQGEGLELDLQRRRNPMWEWLLSHPVGAGAVFFAEMLSPLAANPTYWAAPVFVGIVYGAVQGPLAGLIATIVIGIPFAIAAACVGKALEIGAILRLPPRSRGAVIGILSWFGFASMIAMFFASSVLTKAVLSVGDWIETAAQVPLPLLSLFLGRTSDGSYSFATGMLFDWVATAMLIGAAVAFSSRSIRNGLSGAFASDTLPKRLGKPVRFGRQPLFRKELLWFVRDRSAIVQTILIPLTVAGFQLFNLRGILGHADEAWNYLCGVAIFFGTYFLWVLGPKSLTSEGSALWIALTWPQGLESILKAKAWLWSMIATGLVLIILLWACWLFPTQSWKIALVAVGWLIFARSMAEKSVTLVTVTSESGEAEKVSSGRRWAAQLGMLTFAVGVVTGQWHLAIVGIVYSWITAAAMWENMRAWLPYLYDPWSEALPRPPTLMHAMVAISILVECAAVITALVFGIGGQSSLGIGQALGYAICAVGVTIGVTQFLSVRGVSIDEIWCWENNESLRGSASNARRYLADNLSDARWLAYGVGGGVALGLFAHFYLGVIQFIPTIADMVQSSQREMHSIPGLFKAYAVMAILFAPFAEEFLFRGLLYRALDRHWGGWIAVAGAASFFAIYHPPIAWLPVALVGASNCVLFKKSKRLAPAVLLHMTYNIIVVLTT